MAQSQPLPFGNPSAPIIACACASLPGQRKLAWSPLGVRGRVYVAPEGINAQMAVPCHLEGRFELAVDAVEKLKGV